MTAPQPETDQFALYAKAAHLLSRRILANPSDTQSRTDLAYLAARMRGPAGLAAGANVADASSQLAMTTPEAFAVHAFNQIAGMTGEDAPERKDIQVRPRGRADDIAAAQQTLDAASQQSPTASLAGDVTGMAISADVAAGGVVAPTARALAAIPRMGRLGLIRMLGGIARDAMSAAKPQPAVAEMAAKTAAQVVADAGGSESRALEVARKTLFGNRELSSDDAALLNRVAEGIRKQSGSPASPAPVMSSAPYTGQPWASQTPSPETDIPTFMRRGTSSKPLTQPSLPPSPGSSAVAHIAHADAASDVVTARARILMQDGFSHADATEAAQQGMAVPRARLETMLGRRFPGTQKWI